MNKIHLFDKILEAKRTIMICSYGELIQKTPETDIKYMKKEDLLRHVSNYYHHIKSWTDLRNCYYLRMETFESLDESYRSAHLGSRVLSYSKRLMNRVICTAHEEEMKISYIDTDSITLMKKQFFL